MCDTYSVARRTRRWPHVIFQELVNMAGVNGMILYKLIHGNYNGFRCEYFKDLGRELCMNHLKIRCQDMHIPRSLREMAAKHANMDISSDAEKDNLEPLPKKAKCGYCPRNTDRKMKQFCCICRKAICGDHIISLCSNCHK